MEMEIAKKRSMTAAQESGLVKTECDVFGCLCVDLAVISKNS